MKHNPYRTSVEDQVLGEEPDWQKKYIAAAAERDHWQDQAYALEARLAALDAPSQAHCSMAGCGRKIAATSRTQLCPGHMQAAWEDMNAAWEQQADMYPDRAPAGGADKASSWVVYYIQMGHCVKIGRTYNLRSRMKAFYAQPEQLLAVEPGVVTAGGNREAQRHQQFARYRRGSTELFHLSDEVRAHIEQVRAMFGDPQRFLEEF